MQLAFYRKLSVYGGFAVLMLVLVLGAVTTRSRLAVENQNQQWVQHTQQVQLELATLESLLKDAETGQRGYLYTGATHYLEPYFIATRQIGPHLDALAALIADNSKQSAQ